MLKTIASPSEWRPQTYICRACQLHLNSIRHRRNPVNLRWQARQQSTTTNESNNDAWAEGFNDIGRIYDRQVLNAGPTKHEQATHVRKGVTIDVLEGKGDAVLRSASDKSQHARASTAAGQKRRTTAVRRLAIDLKHGRPRKGARAKPNERSRADLAAKEKNEIGGIREQDIVADKRKDSTEQSRGLEVVTPDLPQDPVNARTTLPSNQSRRRPNGDEAGLRHNREVEVGRKSHKDELHVATNTVSKKVHDKKVRKNVLKAKTPNSPPGASNIAQTSEDSSPTQKVIPADEIFVPLGKINGSRTSSQNPSSQRSGYAQSQQKGTSYSNPQSIFQKVMEAKNRVPWGGVIVATESASFQGASFESLRKADKISVKEPVSTLLSARPFGLLSGEGPSSDDLSRSLAQESKTEDKTIQDDGDQAQHHQTSKPGDNGPLPPTQSLYANTKSEPSSSEDQQSAPADAAHLRLAALHDSSSTISTPKLSPSTTTKNDKGSVGLTNIKSSSARNKRRRARIPKELPAKDPKPLIRSSGSTSTSSGAGHDRLTGMSIAEAMTNKKNPSPLLPHSDPTELVSATTILSLDPSELTIAPLDIAQPPVPYLEYGLDRVLFNPGVYQLQDPKSRVYNFDPYLQKIMPVLDFDFDSLKQYKTSSQDEALALLAQEQAKKYIGSTSSMTGTLSHFHFLLSNLRPLNMDMFSNAFAGKGITDKFTKINQAPNAIFLRWKDGAYAIDADKEYDSPNVLMLLGKSMELLLTLPTSEYERYRKSDPRSVPEEQKLAPESYQYSTMGDFLMRSQLDAYDPRLPGNGTFDLKTRAVVSVRMSSQDYEPMTGYELYSLQGKWGSYEREYYDMMRATMLKYMLQARMGRMNGIFVAYHNVKRIFGFQYIPMHEMDRALHGQLDSCLGDQEFKASLDMLNKVLDKATAKFPEQSLRLHFEARQTSGESSITSLHCFAEPMGEAEIERIQNSQKDKVAAFEREAMGAEGAGAQAPPPKLHSDGGEGAESIHRSTIDNLPSESRADTHVPNSSSEGKDEDLKPLFYSTIIVQSRVNGQLVPSGRPQDLKPTDKWTMDYLFKEFDISRREWSLYEDVKSRRKKILWDEGDEEDGGDVESGGRVKKPDYYIDYLQGLAERGRKWRKKVDEQDAGRETILLEKGLPQYREKIDDLEDYMAWLYKR